MISLLTRRSAEISLTVSSYPSKPYSLRSKLVSSGVKLSSRIDFSLSRRISSSRLASVRSSEASVSTKTIGVRFFAVSPTMLRSTEAGSDTALSASWPYWICSTDSPFFLAFRTRLRILTGTRTISLLWTIRSIWRRISKTANEPNFVPQV